MLEKQLITMSEAAKMTGVSASWWRHAIAGRKTMPPVRVIRLGGAVRLHLQDLIDWINCEGCITPVQHKRRGRPRKTRGQEEK